MMNGDTETIYVALAVLGALTNLFLVWLGWRLPKTQQARVFLLLALSQVVWAVPYIGEVVSDDLVTMLTFAKIEYLGIVSTPVFWLLFALVYSGNGQLLKPRNIIGLFIIPTIVLISVWTNEQHHYHYASTQIDLSQGFPLLEIEIGPTYILNVVYAQLLMLVATVIVILTALRSQMLHRSNGILLVVAWGIVWIFNLLFIANASPLPGFDLTPLVFGIVGLIIVSVVIDLGVLVGIPVAVDLVIHGLPSGIIVLDPEDNIIQINKPALELLNIQQRDILGRKFTLLREQHPQVIEIYESLSRTTPETEQRDEARLERNESGAHIEVSINSLVNQSGYKVGQLISLLDIEDLKRFQITAAKRYAELAALRYIDVRMTSTLDIEQVLEVALRSAIDMTAADAGFIALAEGDVHHVVHTVGTTPRRVGDRLPNERGTTGRVIRQRKPELITDVTRDPDVLPSYSGITSQIIIPLEVRDELIGVLHLDATDPESFTDDSYAFAQTLGGRIAVAIENARLYSTSRQQLEELQKLYEHVSTLEQTKTDMIRLASHDLRSPLGTVLGYLDLLDLDKDQLTQEHQEYVRMMIDRMDKMQTIVNDILTLERLETEGKSLTLRSIDLQSLIVKALDSINGDLNSKSQTLHRNLPDSSVMVWADPVQLYEAIHNLLENAIKYTPDGGEITVELVSDLEKKKARFDVIDTGYGIPEELQGRLFEPFYRANRSDISTIEGTGLGLHLVKSIVERQYGSVHYSTKVGEGSTFGFEIVLANR